MKVAIEINKIYMMYHNLQKRDTERCKIKYKSKHFFKNNFTSRIIPRNPIMNVKA